MGRSRSATDRTPDRLDGGVEMAVYGMTCAGCATTLKLGLSQLQGVQRVDVDVAGNHIVVRGSAELNEQEIASRIEHLGYSLTPPASARASRPKFRSWLRPAALVAALALLGVLGTLGFSAASDAYFRTGALERLNAVFSEISALTVGLALLFGLVVGFAPSTYAMAPAVMGYVTGARATSITQAAKLSASFVAGMVVIDMVVGGLFAVFGAAALSFFGERLPLWYALVIVVLVALALVNLKLWRPKLPSFVPQMNQRHTAGGAFALGLPFGLLTCPACTPLLLPVALGAAATGQAWYGAVLLGAFAVGRGIPLTVLGASTGLFEKMRGATRWVPWVERSVGILLLVGAIYFFNEFLMMGGFSALF